MKMKYRWLMPIALSAMMVLSVYSLITSSIETQNNVRELTVEAEACAAQGLYDKAAKYYSEAASMDSKIDYYLSIADMYFEAEQYSESCKWCEEMLSLFPEEEWAYERGIKACLAKNAYSDAYEILDDFNGRGIQSESVDDLKKEMKFLHWSDSLSFDEILQPGSGYAAYQKKEKWGLANNKGSSKVQASFAKIGYYANDMVAVQAENEEWYFMQSDGELIYNISVQIDGNVTDVGLYNNGLFPVCVDGKYSYYDIEFNRHFDEYDFAGSLSGGVAAVRLGDEWEIINSDGKNITGEKYTDVILDERGVCCRKDRIFVKTDSGYIMINASGERIGGEFYDDARLFSTDDYAAVKTGNLWGFTDINGNKVIEAQYDDAGSFSMGLAAVCQNGLWGYIDIDGTEQIKCQYTRCYDFTSSGTAFAKDEMYWNVIKLYEYNH